MLFVRRSSLVAIVTLAAACTPVASTVEPPGAPPTTVLRRLPNDIHWVRTSAEYRALALQVYRDAADRLTELARDRARGSWAVILDADDTVLDNSEYQRRRALVDSGFTEASWARWVLECSAPAVPGAIEFVRGVRELGGRVAIVTNRADSVCAATRDNLRAVGIDADIVLCKPEGESDKNPRFRRVETGAAAPSIPALIVLQYIGDNIQDFPSLTQSTRGDSAALAQFGRRYFVLPNPMYGSWERNPDR